MIQNGTYNVDFLQSWGRIPITVSVGAGGGLQGRVKIEVQ